MVEGHVTKLKLIRKTGIWQGRLSTAAQAGASCSVAAREKPLSLDTSRS